MVHNRPPKNDNNDAVCMINGARLSLLNFDGNGVTLSADE